MKSSDMDLSKVAIGCSATLKGRALKALSRRVGGLLEVLSLSDREIKRWLYGYKRVFEGKDEMYRKAEQVLAQCKKHHIRVLFISDEGYPLRLREIYNPPLLLYYKGEVPDEVLSLERKVFSVVGSRSMDEVVKDLTFQWSSYLTGQGVYIISGLALGTDAMAHWGALQEGKTTAVLGGGVDVVYPYGNGPLYKAILAGGGCLFSEHGPGVRPMAYHFPMRNRIINGLCDGVLLMQTEVKGGGMITARYAIDENRDLLVYGGQALLDSFSGNQFLIAQGAKAVHSEQDFDKIFGFQLSDTGAGKEVDLQPHEARIVEALGGQKVMSLVDLSRHLMVGTDELSGMLLGLVLRDVVGEAPGKCYYRKRFG